MIEDFDITGFVSFPSKDRREVKISDTSQTLIYLISIDMENKNSRVNLVPEGIFIGDDITFQSPKIIGEDLEEIIERIKSKDQYPQTLNASKSINVISAILIGWSKLNYTNKNDMSPWICSFRDLTREGRRLYYSIRKLHNESEVRILTFNKI